MKKIAIFAGYYPPTIGGYPKNVHEIARRLVKRGYQVDVYTCNVDGSPTGTSRLSKHILEYTLECTRWSILHPQTHPNHP